MYKDSNGIHTDVYGGRAPSFLAPGQKKKKKKSVPAVKELCTFESFFMPPYFGYSRYI